MAMPHSEAIFDAILLKTKDKDYRTMRCRKLIFSKRGSSRSKVIRLIEEKYCRNIVDIMAWSKTMDLLAVSNPEGQVNLHRLTWQRIWTLAPPSTNTLVKAICWRPDGRVLAVAYSNREVILVDVETMTIVHKLKANHDISFLSWDEEFTPNEKDDNMCIEENSVSSYTDELMTSESADEDDQITDCNEDDKQCKIAQSNGIYINGRLSRFLKEKENEECPIEMNVLPLKSTEDGNSPQEQFRKLVGQEYLTFLMIGTENGLLDIYILGMFYTGSIDIKIHSPPGYDKHVIISAKFARYLSSLLVITRHENPEKTITNAYMLNTDNLEKYCQLLFTLVCRYGRITNLIDYLNATINSIVQSWENILLHEMELKLGKYAEGKEKGVVSCELLELFLMGTYTPDMEHFLLHQLSDKRLKKLGNTIETSHSNIQKVILQNLRPVIENILKVLITYLASSKQTNIPDNFKMDSETVLNGLTVTGALYNKAYEMLSIIENSSFRYKGTFKWLTNIIGKLNEDRNSNIIMPDISQQEVSHITKYLYDIERLCKKSKIKDEIGQYLTDENLAELNYETPWNDLLKDNPCLGDNLNIIPPKFGNCSLIQVQNLLNDSVGEIFKKFENNIIIGNNNDVKKKYELYGKIEDEKNLKKILNTILENNKLLIVNGYKERTKIEIIEIDMRILEMKKVVIMTVDIEGNPYNVLDMEFYNGQILSLLLTHTNESYTSYLVQVPLSEIKGYFKNADGEDGEGNFEIISLSIHRFKMQILKNMFADKLIVNGFRRVSALVSKCKHRIKIFDMEAEEEEDDDDDEDEEDICGNEEMQCDDEENLEKVEEQGEGKKIDEMENEEEIEKIDDGEKFGKIDKNEKNSDEFVQKMLKIKSVTKKYVPFDTQVRNLLLSDQRSFLNSEGNKCTEDGEDDSFGSNLFGTSINEELDEICEKLLIRKTK